ncbi:MAG: hypothetical protein AAGA65_08605 [Actinomycetota bacterium]
MRPGLLLTAAAAALAVAVGGAVWITAVEGRAVVAQLVAASLVIHLYFLIIGSARWIGISSLPLLGSALIEAGLGDGPSWLRSLAIGCGWFVAVEVGWEAIERRKGARYTAAATARRIQEVLTVVGVSVVLGGAATVTASLAPARSVPVQAVVIGGLLVALAGVVRALVPQTPAGPSSGPVNPSRQPPQDPPPFPGERSDPLRSPPGR